MRIGAVLVAVLFSAASAARAGESVFNRAYTTDTVPMDRWQLEQDARERSGRTFGRYDAWDLRTRVQVGLRDDLQLTLNVSYLQLRASGAPDDYSGSYAAALTTRKAGLQSVSIELLRRFTSPERDPVGLALAVEPELEFLDFHNGHKFRGSRLLRARGILQKNFLGDRLVVVANTSVAFVSEQTIGVSQSRETEIDWYNEIAATMRVASHWTLGAEARNYNDYPDAHRPDNSTYSLGPVAHYGAQRYWATAGFLCQVYGTPNGPGYGKNLYLRGSERMEASLKLGVPF